MKKGWKIFWIILIILIIIGIIILAYKQYQKWKGVWDNISFSKPIPTNLDLKGLTLQDFLTGTFLTGKPIDVDADLKMFVTNNSDTTVSFDKFRIKILYNGQLITETSEKLYNDNFVLEKKDTNTGKPGLAEVKDTININVNKATDFLKQKALGNHPKLDYKVDINVNGIPVSKIYPIEGTFDW